MKKPLTIIAVFIINIITLQAQDNKPTKEETIAFVQSYFTNLEIKTDCRDDINFTYSEFQVYFDPNSYELMISWKEYGKLPTPLDKGETINYSIIADLNKIESIQIVSKNFCHESGTIAVKFNAIPGHQIEVKKEKESVLEKNTSIPIDNYYGGDLDLNNYKIAQAFNHLRKLCGAPEPISFD